MAKDPKETPIDFTKLLDGKILTPGERIREIRLTLGIKQDELSDGLFKRTYLSKIENNGIEHIKRLTIRKIIKNLNRLAEEKDIKIVPITEEIILKDIVEQINSYFDHVMKELKRCKMFEDQKGFIFMLKDVEKVINRLTIPRSMIWDQLFKIYEFALDYYKEKFEFENCERYLLKCANIAATKQDYNTLANLIIKFMNISSSRKNIEMALKIGNFAIILVEAYNINEPTIIMPIYYNLALANRKLGKLNDCLYWIRKLQKNFSLNQRQNMDVNMLRANCLYLSGKFNEAEKIYTKLLDEATVLEEEREVARCLRNLAMCNLKNNNIDEARVFIKQSKEIKNIKNKVDQSEIYFYSGLIEMDNNDCIEAARDFDKSLEYARDVKDEVMIVNNYVNMIKCYINRESDKEIDSVIAEAERQVLKYGLRNRDIEEVFLLASRYYIDQDKAKCSAILDKMYNVIKILKENSKIDV